MTRIIHFEELCKDNKCFGVDRKFKSKLGRRYFFKKEEAHPDYEPFDEKKFTAYIMSAIPGSGKDTYIKNNLFDIPVVSIDELRRSKKVKRGDKKAEGHVYQEIKEMCKVYMRAKKDFVFNATNITKDMRGKSIKEFEEYGAKVEIIYIEVPYKQLLSQNHNRDHKVPEDALNSMINALEVPDVTECYDVKYNIKESINSYKSLKKQKRL